MRLKILYPEIEDILIERLTLSESKKSDIYLHFLLVKNIM